MNDNSHHDFTLPHEKQPKKHNKRPNSGPALKDIIHLIELFQKDPSICEMTWKDFCIKRSTVSSIQTSEPAVIYQAPQAKPEVTKPEPKSKLHSVTSPMVGTCYLAPAPDADNFTDINKKVKKGDTICLIEAMKMFNKIKADVSGTIKKCLVEDGQPIEFGQALFEIDETGA